MTESTKTRILVVEDESIVAADIEEGLRSAGYEVVGMAASGRSAITLAESFQPDLVLMDIRLQGKMTGIEAAQEIGSRFHIPIIFLTAHSDEVTIQLAKKVQPFGYLLKPFGQRELRASIETSLFKADVERKLSESEQWNRLVVETAHDGFVAMDAEGRVTDWNPSAQKIFGWSSQEAIGQELVGMIVPERFREAFLAGLHRFLKTGEGPNLNKRIEVPVLRRDGHESPVELAMAVAHFGGKPRFLAFIQDLSDRKRLELERRHGEELERSNKELERFAHITSHDLQEPLRTVSMYIQLLETRLDGKLNEEEKQFFQHVFHGARRMREMVEDLLEYSKVGACEVERFEKVDFTEVLNAVLENLQTTIRDSGAKITHESLPTVAGQLSLLTQLLQNLIFNSIKFHGDNPPAIHISAKREMESWVFSVRDTGIGFEQLHAERLFNMFSRLNRADEYSGTGMGLAICKRIVEMHGGHIWAKSKPGEGATFFFSLPLAERARENSIEGMRILLVDDSPADRNIVRDLLGKTGARLEVVANGEEALAKTQASKFDLILMDIELPGLDGIEVASRMRKNGLGTPVVGYTGHGIEGVKELAPPETFSDYYSKSSPPERLVAQLSKWYRRTKRANQS